MFQHPGVNEEEYAIIVENVSKHFRIPCEKKNTVFEHIAGILGGRTSRYKEFCALEDVSFKVKKGETLGIIGENGSGKSTLLKIIAGVLSPDSGSVKVMGKIAPFLELGVGFQPDLTAEDNVRLYGAVMGMKKEEMEEKFDEIFEFAELEKFRQMKLKSFSSGMYARLAFATAVATEPDILLIDEVLAVGDMAFQKKCLDQINEYKNNNKTIIFVSHDIQSIKKICNFVMLLQINKPPLKGVAEIIAQKYFESSDFTIENSSFPRKRRASTVSLRAEIMDVRILDENRNLVKNIHFKSVINIICRLKFNDNIDKPVIGIIIRDLNGNEVYNTNNLWQNVQIGNYLKGDLVDINFVCSNYLNNGTYSITVGLSDSTTTEFFDWYDNFIVFHVDGNEKSKGVVNLCSKIKVELIE